MAAKDDYARGAFCHSGFRLGRGFVVRVVDSCEVVFDLEEVGLFGAQAAGDTADGALGAGHFTGFPGATRHAHHIFLAERDHFNEVSRAGA